MENNSGMRAVQDKVILQPLEVAPTVGEARLVKPQITIEQEKLAQTYAYLISIGGNAFETWDGDKPHVGDLVYVCRYAGVNNILGADEKRYQICSDRDITAIIDKLPESEDSKGWREPLYKSNEVNN